MKLERMEPCGSVCGRGELASLRVRGERLIRTSRLETRNKECRVTESVLVSETRNAKGNQCRKEHFRSIPLEYAFISVPL